MPTGRRPTHRPNGAPERLTGVGDGTAVEEIIDDDLVTGEVVDAVYSGPDASTVALTNRRLIILEPAFDERTALLSVPFSRVTSVAYLSPPAESVASSSILEIKVGRGAYYVGFRSQGQAREAHGSIMWQLIGR
ncbi:MAG TPA: hypothetical protein VGH99_13780 [Pseudonocardia sp.]